MDKKVVLILILVVAAALVYWYSTTMNTTSAPKQATATTPVATPVETAKGVSTTTGPSIPLKVIVGPKGEYLADKNGLTLYVDIKDEGQTGKFKASCDAACEKTWIPYLFDKSDYNIIGSSTPLFSKINVINRPDGTQQYALGTKPLYRYVGDVKSGDIKGPVTGDWMVAAVVLKKP
jgi:predicted lipoprotein with Yx(FWY)xxD motif